MDALAAGDVFLFDGFRLDRRGGGLFRRDERGDFVPIAIGSRALDVLGVLVERPGDLVSRDAIIAAVWPATVVEDANLNMQIAALRRVLDEGRAEGSCIQTVPGRGYRFVAPVTRSDPTPPYSPPHLPAMGAAGQLSRTSNCTIHAFWPDRCPAACTGIASAALASGRHRGRAHRRSGPRSRGGWLELALALVRRRTPGASPIDCRAAVRQSERRPGAAIFR